LEVQRITAVGGGARSSLWRQIKADVTGLPVRVPREVETTATGAAVLAVVAAGVGLDAALVAERFVDYEPAEHEPDPASTRRYDTVYAGYRDYYDALYR
jgi:xylulokinase